MQALVNSKMLLTPWPYLRAGQLVRIDNGPLAGVEGIVIHAEDSKPRVIVSVEMFLRSVAVEVEREWISSVAEAKPEFSLCGAA